MHMLSEDDQTYFEALVGYLEDGGPGHPEAVGAIFRSINVPPQTIMRLVDYGTQELKIFTMGGDGEKPELALVPEFAERAFKIREDVTALIKANDGALHPGVMADWMNEAGKGSTNDYILIRAVVAASITRRQYKFIKTGEGTVLALGRLDA